MSGKKLINDPDSTVDEALSGLVASRHNLALIEGRRVVVVKDLADVKGRVAVICGGGSGHEPAFAGYVGRGMLDGAIAGSVFTSPPVDDVLSAIMTLAESGASAVLILVINYTGDRINFGLAAERAKSTGVNCQIVSLGEDCALQSQDRTAGRRGLAGIVPTIKIAGALAQRRKPLEEIVGCLQRDVLPPKIGTIGLSLTPCTLPGRDQPSFTLESDEMILGLGIHGEAGVKRMPLGSAAVAVKAMLDHLTSPGSSTRMDLAKGDKVVVVVNNLGSVTNLEMGILTNEVINQLTKNLEVVIERYYCGAFVTSLEMSGFSISVLKLSPETRNVILDCLDSPAETLGWTSTSTASCNIPDPERARVSDPLKKGGVNYSAKRSQGPRNTEGGSKTCAKSVDFACEALISCEAMLNTMDSGSGDGDCGSTLRRGAEELQKRISKDPTILDHLTSLLWTVADVAENTMGGSSGAMYSILTESAAAVLSKQDSLHSKNISQAFDEGAAAMQVYGGAQLGDRTMLDALLPSLAALRSTIADADKTDLEAFEAATCAAEKGASDTLGLKAKAGRASYVDANELKHPDPGAHAVGIIMRALYQGYKLVNPAI